MDIIELEVKRDEKTINDFAKNLQLISNTIIVTKEELLHKSLLKM